MISDKTKKAIEELDRIIKDPATKEAVGDSYDDICDEFTTAQGALAKGETAKALESFKSLATDVYRCSEEAPALIEQTDLVVRLFHLDTYCLPTEDLVPARARALLQQETVMVRYQNKTTLIAKRTSLADDFCGATWSLRDETDRVWATIRFSLYGCSVLDVVDKEGKSYSTSYRHQGKEGGEKQIRIGHAHGASSYIHKKLTALGVVWMRHPAETSVSVLAVIDVLHSIADDTGRPVDANAAAFALLEKFCYRHEEK